MIQDVSPPAYHCVKPEDVTSRTKGSSFITVSGSPQHMAAFLAEASKSTTMTIEAEAETNGVAFARFRGGLDMPYRQIGGMMYSAQRWRLAVAITTDPLICEAEEK